MDKIRQIHIFHTYSRQFKLEQTSRAAESQKQPSGLEGPMRIASEEYVK